VWWTYSSKGYQVEADGSGKFKEIPVPGAMKDLLESAREQAHRAHREADDRLLEKYLEVRSSPPRSSRPASGAAASPVPSSPSPAAPRSGTWESRCSSTS